MNYEGNIGGEVSPKTEKDSFTKMNLNQERSEITLSSIQRTPEPKLSKIRFKED